MCTVPPRCRMSDAFITALHQRQLTHREDRMTSQLSYLIAQQRQAELVSRAEQARLASEACVAREEPRPATPHAGLPPKPPGSPRLWATALNSPPDGANALALPGLHAPAGQ